MDQDVTRDSPRWRHCGPAGFTHILKNTFLEPQTKVLNGCLVISTHSSLVKIWNHHAIDQWLFLVPVKGGR